MLWYDQQQRSEHVKPREQYLGEAPPKRSHRLVLLNQPKKPNENETHPSYGSHGAIYQVSTT